MVTKVQDIDRAVRIENRDMEKSRELPSSKKLAAKPQNLKSGYPASSFGRLKAKRLIVFEVEELGNTRIMEEAANSLGCNKDLASVLQAIENRWGSNAEAIWLCEKKIDAVASDVCSGFTKEIGKPKPDLAYRVTLPDNAKIISDLKGVGKLYVYVKDTPHSHKF